MQKNIDIMGEVEQENIQNEQQNENFGGKEKQLKLRLKKLAIIESDSNIL